MSIGIRNKAIILAYIKGYRVSECGKVVTYKGKERKLQGYKNAKKIYYRFSIYMDTKCYNIKVHRLQAFQKFGNKLFKENIVVRHKNDNSEDNSYINITIGTQQQNMIDKSKNGRKR